MLNFNINEHKYNHIHFIGIGGVSMSALAELCINYKYQVSGSDKKLSEITNHLEQIGATIYQNHNAHQIEGADLVIYTDAVSLDNPELRAAIHQKIDVMDRATFLGAVMKNYEISIAVSGTHGKTSTTSMITRIIKDLPLKPTILLGGNSDDIHGNVLVGNEGFFLTEACEYRANVLKYSPTTAIILNIDEDHLDYFDNIEHIIKTFQGYVNNLGKDDILILNIDDENAHRIKEVCKAQLFTTSIKQDADYQAKNLQITEDGLVNYELYIRGEYKGNVNLQVLGQHNVSNSLAAIAACYENGVPLESCIDGIFHYKGVHRRLEFKGEKNNIRIIDDYAHHPTEIASSLHALRPIVDRQLICIFQPHTFTRTKLLLDSFSKSFHEADQIIITDIYAAREKDYGDIHSKTLVKAIKKEGDNAKYIATHEEVLDYIKQIAKPGDIVVTMGAGDIYQVGEAFLEKEKSS